MRRTGYGEAGGRGSWNRVDTAACDVDAGWEVPANRVSERGRLRAGARPHRRVCHVEKKKEETVRVGDQFLQL